MHYRIGIGRGESDNVVTRCGVVFAADAFFVGKYPRIFDDVRVSAQGGTANIAD